MRRWRYRPVQAVAIAVLAALVAACALFAPLYDRAMQQSLTQVTIDRAPVLTSSVQLTVSNTDDILQPVTPPETVAGLLPEGFRPDFRPVVLGYGGSAAVLPGGGSDPIGDLVWRSGQCDHVTIEEGRCPEAPGEVLVSRADARIFDLDVGATTEVSGRLYQEGRFLRSRTLPLTVVGTYRQDPDDYWFGRVLTGWSGVDSLDTPPHVQHDVWLTVRDTFEGASALADTTSSWAGYRIDPERAGVDEVLELGPAIADLADRPQRLGDLPVQVASGIADLSEEIEAQIDQSRITVPLLMAQLGLLAVVVLWLVLLGVTEQRRPEVALAQLRGHGRRGARSLLLAELLPITLAGLLPGALLALVAAWSARTVALPGDVPLELRLPVILAAVLAAVVLVVVTVIASVRVSREPVAALLRRVPPRQSTWALGALDAVVVTGCGAVVVLFATGGLEGPAAMVAPALLAVVAGVLLAHVTTPAASLLGRAQLRRGRVRAGVSILDAARSPVTRRTIAVVTLASALAVFSADALLIGERNRAAAAEQAAGAPLVADVQGTDLASVRAALDEVDPGGQQATPVVRVPAPDADAGETLGVLPDGFRAVALFPGGTPDSAVWDELRPPETAAVVLTGRTFTLDADDSTLGSVRVDGSPYPVTVGVDLVSPAGEVLHTTLGRLSGPTEHAVLRGTAPCTEGCTVTSIWFGSLPGARIAGRVTLGNLEVAPSGERVALGPADLWTPFRERTTGKVVPRSTSADALVVEVQGAGASLLTMQSAWMPDVTPTLTSGALPVDAVGKTYQLIGLHGESQPAEQVGTLDRVPGSGPRTFVADLDTLQRGRVVSTSDRVAIWFADDDPQLLGAVRAALDERGVSIARTTTLADVRQGYDETAAAWSLQLAALVGVLAILIALLVLVVSAASTWRSRSRDLAALRMSGIPVRTVRTMAVAAQVPAVLLGVAAGTACGLVGASLVMPTVPLFAAPPEVSTLDLGTAWTGVVGAALAAAIVLGVASALIGRALAARSDVRRLREAGL
ncbi:MULTISPECIES: FtsX-like permease family protein [unclassified Nocardioides]|uniref:FtsX-like permease family protein n=1 Tax=unclassified Nocardioides TaxID=2615069 RepID=UPI0036246949